MPRACMPVGKEGMRSWCSQSSGRWHKLLSQQLQPFPREHACKSKNYQSTMWDIFLSTVEHVPFKPIAPTSSSATCCIFLMIIAIAAVKAPKGEALRVFSAPGSDSQQPLQRFCAEIRNSFIKHQYSSAEHYCLLKA